MKDKQFEKELLEAEFIWIENRLLGKTSHISFLNYIINGKQKIIEKKGEKMNEL